MERRINAPDKDWLTSKEVAEWLNISTAVLREMVDSGDFPRPFRVSKKGKKLMWVWMDVVAYAHLASRKAPWVEPTPAKKTGAT